MSKQWQNPELKNLCINCTETTEDCFMDPNKNHECTFHCYVCHGCMNPANGYVESSTYHMGGCSGKPGGDKEPEKQGFSCGRLCTCGTVPSSGV